MIRLILIPAFFIIGTQIFCQENNERILSIGFEFGRESVQLIDHLVGYNQFGDCAQSNLIPIVMYRENKELQFLKYRQNHMRLENENRSESSDYNYINYNINEKDSILEKAIEILSQS